MSQVAKRLYIEPRGFSKHFEDIKTLIEARFTVLEKKMDILINSCSTLFSCLEGRVNEDERNSNTLLSKINFIEEFIRTLPKLDLYKDSKCDRSPPVVLLPSSRPAKDGEGRNPQVIALTSEEDIPDGSWLGDKDNPKCRVRVKIPPDNLFHIDERCITPEKMALTLLDYLFPREVLAVSNISGKGKHCKEQLDPLLIYAIRCHLVYKFNITDEDWHRIKQNIDSKCRAVWRKKMKGLPLATVATKSTNLMLSDPLSEESSDGYQTSIMNFTNPVTVLRQSKDQLLQIHGGQTIKVFTDEEFKELLPTSVELFSVEDNDCFSLTSERMIVNESSSPDKVLEDDPIYSRDK